MVCKMKRNEDERAGENGERELGCKNEKQTPVAKERNKSKST